MSTRVLISVLMVALILTIVFAVVFVPSYLSYMAATIKKNLCMNTKGTEIKSQGFKLVTGQWTGGGFGVHAMGFYDLLHLASNYNDGTVTSDMQGQYQFFFIDNGATYYSNPC